MKFTRSKHHTLC